MGVLPAHLEEAFRGRYRVERELGRGGMAVVYLATDLRHSRPVAIKVVDPQLAGLVSADRFLQEIRLMATLQHPHILSLFDSGQVEGDLYYVMPYIEGETLRQRIAREGRLGVQAATGLASQIAGALDYAHRHGVVHRDIKPENILLSDGHALVADFGIARALLSDAETERRITATGMTLGTPGYMSPEQAAGDRKVDARTDIYALGAVTHEMLAGEPPFTGPSAQAVLARVLTQQPPPLTQLRPGIAPGLSAVVQKAMASEPGDRYESAAAFGAALASLDTPVAAGGRGRRVLAGLAVAVVVAVVAWRATASRLAGTTDRVRLAVMPLREVGQSRNLGFAEGVVASLRSDLASLPGVDVIAGASIDALGDSARSPAYVSQQLGATHLLTGSLLWDATSDGNARVRLVPELIAVVDGQTRSQTGEAITDRVEDLFQTQARFATQIARSLGVRVSAEAGLRLATPPTRNREAYEALLRARIDYENELEHLRHAVALDSGFAVAWAALGMEAALRYENSLDPGAAALARDASGRAMALDSTLGQSRLARALYERHVVRNFDEAIRHGQVALTLLPGDADVAHFQAAALFNARRMDEALALAERAASLDPRSASALARVATVMIWRRDFTGAEAPTGRALAASRRSVAFVNLDSILLPLAAGDTLSARRFVSSLGAAESSTTALASREWNMAWAFDSAQVARAAAYLRASGQALSHHKTLLQSAMLRGDGRRQRAFADSVQREALARMQGLPDEPRLRMTLAYALAGKGLVPQALAQLDTASAVRSAWKDGFQGAPLSLNVAELRSFVGDTDHAIALLDSLLAMPGFVTPAYLRVDPWFQPLRRDARFQSLISR